LCPLKAFNLTKNLLTKQSTDFNHCGQWWHLLPEKILLVPTFWRLSRKEKPVTIEGAKKSS